MGPVTTEEYATQKDSAFARPSIMENNAIKRSILEEQFPG